MAVRNHAPTEIAAGIKRASTHSQDGNEVFFSIKHSTQLKKLMNAYCDRRSVEMNAIVFLFDWLCLRAKQTPDEVRCSQMSKPTLVSTPMTCVVPLFHLYVCFLHHNLDSWRNTNKFTSEDEVLQVYSPPFVSQDTSESNYFSKWDSNSFPSLDFTVDQDDSDY
ncbi:small ubiquitin-related modifier 1 [Artemisia annua]|uniref:Small ubiquitin-related modifier 1 n=1 Tax=Artemisia annua TaxID=35608 RepID=A0A2U1KXE7_ARTAN|nr:small ubiquitin-related modifier 1 [Artemisia annua]